MISKLGWVAALLVSASLLTGCGKKLEGVYKDDLGIQKYEFQSDGTVYISTIGMTDEATYVIEDQKVKIYKGRDEPQIFNLNQDGSIRGPLGLELRPQPSSAN